jgi:hypothetical protein
VTILQPLLLDTAVQTLPCAFGQQNEMKSWKAESKNILCSDMSACVKKPDGAWHGAVMHACNPGVREMEKPRMASSGPAWAT